MTIKVNDITDNINVEDIEGFDEGRNKVLFGNVDTKFQTLSKESADIFNSLGFAYEFGYNTRALSSIKRYFKGHVSKPLNKMETINKAISKKHLTNRDLITRQILHHKITDTGKKELYSNLFNNVFFNGLIQGEYMTDLFLKEVNPKDIYYVQMNFANPIGGDRNSTLENDVPAYQCGVIRDFLNISAIDDYERFNRTGEFLKADSIIAVTDYAGNLHILVTDNKVNLQLALTSGKENPKYFIKGLGRLKHNKTKKTSFKNLNIDTEYLNLNISSGLVNYCQAIADKSILKTVQAGSYAESFYRFLNKHGKLKEFKGKQIYIYALGMADTDMSLFKIKLDSDDSLKKLKDMSRAYKALNRQMTPDEQSRIVEASLYKILKAFNCKDVTKGVMDMKNGIYPMCPSDTPFTFTETIEGYAKMTDMIDGKTVWDTHADKFFEWMDSDSQVAFLIGCPGAGKTTALLKSNKNKDKYLCLYASCRLAVNEDFLSKHFENDGERLVPIYDDMIIANALSTDEEKIDDKKVDVLNVYAKDLSKLPTCSKLTMLDGNRERIYEERKELYSYYDMDNTITKENSSKSGVMDRTFRGLSDLVSYTDYRKIVSTITIQAQKAVNSGYTSNHIYKLMGKAVKYNRHGKGNKKYSLDIGEFIKFTERVNYLIIMIDEITGSSEGVSLYTEIKRLFIDVFDSLFEDKNDAKRDAYLKSIKDRLKIKIIVADANIASEEVIEKHLSGGEKYQQDCIYCSNNIGEGTKGVTTKITKDNCWIINANAYPADKLEMKYNVFIDTRESEFETGDPFENSTPKEIKGQRDIIDEAIAKNAVKDIISGKSSQVLIYVQNKQRLQKIIKEISKYGEEHKLEVTEGETLLHITSDLTKEQRAKYIKIINENDTVDKNIVKFVAMTSSASRGLSFKPCNSMHIVLQDYALESYLMELMQAIYRPRGHFEYDRDWTKTLNFYYGKTIYYEDEIEFEANKRRALLDITSYLFTLRTSILTRIQGYGEFADRKISLIPVGGTHVNSIAESAQEDVIDLLKGFNDEIARIKTLTDNKDTQYRVKLFMDSLKEDLIKVFENYRLDLKDEFGVRDFGDIYKSVLKEWSFGLDRVVDMDICPGVFTVNGLLVAKVKPKIQKKDKMDIYKFKTTDKRLRDDLKKALDLFCDYTIRIDNGSDIKFKEANRKLAKKIRTLLAVDAYYEAINHNKYDDTGSSTHRYVAIPIYSLSSLYNSFMTDKIYEEELIEYKVESARSVMERLIRLHTPCYDVGPISDRYTSIESQNIPFITFRANNLQGIQENLFSKNHALCSNEVNVFNLLVLSE